MVLSSFSVLFRKHLLGSRVTLGEKDAVAGPKTYQRQVTAVAGGAYGQVSEDCNKGGTKMVDWEGLILARQERLELREDGCLDDKDDCDGCELLDRCRAAANGEGEFPACPHCYGEEE